MATLAHTLARRPRFAFPSWTVQILLFAGAYAIYAAARWLTTPDLEPAVANAQWVVDLQRSLGVAIEGNVQSALDAGGITTVLNGVYLAAQYLVLPGVLIWLYRSRRDVYQYLRDTILATWLLAIPVHALFPTAPPRLAEMGITDTITTHGVLALDSSLVTSFTNPYAAVPSLHCGFALAVGIAGVAASESRWAKAAWALWPALVALSVVATGNHFVFDVVAGFAITGLGYVAARAFR